MSFSSYGLANGGDGAGDVLLAGLLVDDRDAHGARLIPRGGAEPCLSGPLDVLDHVLGSGIVIPISAEETHKSLIDLGRDEQFRAFQRLDLGREATATITRTARRPRMGPGSGAV